MMHGVESGPFFENIDQMETAPIPNYRQQDCFDWIG
jgi:hypothetical protein